MDYRWTPEEQARRRRLQMIGAFDWPILILAVCGFVILLTVLTITIPPLGIFVLLMIALNAVIFSVYGVGVALFWLCRRLFSSVWWRGGAAA